jgi:O-antigen/teichoic acid export membrane protein
VGVYAVGYKFAFMLNYLVIQPFCAMWEPRRYVIYNDPDHPKIFGQIFVLYALLLVYGGLAVSAFSPEIVKLMVGPKFADSQNVIPIVTLAYVFWGIGYHVQLGMILRNRTKLIGTISAGTVVLNIGLNYFLISAYGMIGAAWATLLSFLATAAGCYWCSQKVLRLPLGIARVAGGVVVAVTIYAISQLVPVESPWMSLLIKSGLLCVFPMAVWKLRILSPGEKTTLLATARSALARAGWLPVAAGKGASA